MSRETNEKILLSCVVILAISLAIFLLAILAAIWDDFNFFWFKVMLDRRGDLWKLRLWSTSNQG